MLMAEMFAADSLRVRFPPPPLKVPIDYCEIGDGSRAAVFSFCLLFNSGLVPGTTGCCRVDCTVDRDKRYS